MKTMKTKRIRKTIVSHREVDLLDNLKVVKCLTVQPKKDSVAVLDAITGKHLFDAPDMESFESNVARPVNVQLRENLWLRLPVEGGVFPIKTPVLYERAAKLLARRRLGRKKRQLLEQIGVIYSGQKTTSPARPAPVVAETLVNLPVVEEPTTDEAVLPDTVVAAPSAAGEDTVVIEPPAEPVTLTLSLPKVTEDSEAGQTRIFPRVKTEVKPAPVAIMPRKRERRNPRRGIIVRNLAIGFAAGVTVIAGVGGGAVALVKMLEAPSPAPAYSASSSATPSTSPSGAKHRKTKESDTPGDQPAPQGDNPTETLAGQGASPAPGAAVGAPTAAPAPAPAVTVTQPAPAAPQPTVTVVQQAPPQRAENHQSGAPALAPVQTATRQEIPVTSLHTNVASRAGTVSFSATTSGANPPPVTASIGGQTITLSEGSGSISGLEPGLYTWSTRCGSLTNTGTINVS
ncbi:hypothetical protein [Mobiluncus mulieris]|uniref:hypothetical protein n=1 Tax=Mobiluncus mulieris TaxID=2052 RepID=UPI0021E330DA|nr:hypothetical protein [Mobiluncus mulieris]MCV0003398.1 hypothetical protein [Mobiluncus mulieris]MCV0011253.1 hypothetical protein [Mobiluncus mulieris]